MVALPLLTLFTTGLLVAGYGFVQYYDAARGNPYDATATGTVLDSALDPDASAERGDYTPDVRYEYVVDGKTYEHDRVRANADSLSRRGGTVLLGEYHADAEVTVHYDPDDPQRAVLVPPEGGGSWLLFVGAGLFVALTAAGLGLLGGA